MRVRIYPHTKSSNPSAPIILVADKQLARVRLIVDVPAADLDEFMQVGRLTRAYAQDNAAESEAVRGGGAEELLFRLGGGVRGSTLMGVVGAAAGEADSMRSSEADKVDDTPSGREIGGRGRALCTQGWVGKTDAKMGMQGRGVGEAVSAGLAS